MKKTRPKKKQVSFQKSDLAFSIDLLSTSMKGGYDLFSCINSLKDLINEPLAQEFKLIIQSRNIGLSDSEALMNFANRLKIPAIHQMVQAILTSMNTGGSACPLLDQIAQDIRKNELSIKIDKTLFVFKSIDTQIQEEAEPVSESIPQSEILKIDEDFLRAQNSILFLREALSIGKNVLIVCHNEKIMSLLVESFIKFQIIDLEKETIAQALLTLSDNPGLKGKLLFIRASSVRAGFQRIKALLAHQENNMSATGLKFILDLFHFIPFQVSVSTSQSKQSWLSEFSELRTILEDGSLLTEQIFQTQITGMNKDHHFLGFIKPTGYIPAAVEDMERNGIEVRREMFFR